MCEEEIKDTENCCPDFDPKPWDNITHLWNEKLFIKDTMPQLFHIPLPGFVNKVIKRFWSKAQSSGAAPELKDFLLLAYDPSPREREFHLAVNKEVPGADNIKLSGKFISKVFDGPFNAIP